MSSNEDEIDTLTATVRNWVGSVGTVKRGAIWGADCEEMQASALRALDILRSAATASLASARDDEREALVAAYTAGAMGVHTFWEANPGEAPCRDPEFHEAADDYARAQVRRP